MIEKRNEKRTETQPRLPDSANLPYVEALYEQYQRDPDSLDPQWRQYFEQIAGRNGKAPTRVGPSFQPGSIFNPRGNGHHAQGHAHAEGNGKAAAETASAAASQSGDFDQQYANLSSLQHRVDQLIRNYRVRGHIVANIDPLGSRNEQPPELDPSFYGFTDEDLERTVYTSNLHGGDYHTLRQIIEDLKHTYCRDIGAQFMHIDNLQVRQWLQDRM